MCTPGYVGYFLKNAEVKPYGLRYLFAFMAFAKGYSAMHLPHRNKRQSQGWWLPLDCNYGAQLTDTNERQKSINAT